MVEWHLPDCCMTTARQLFDNYLMTDYLTTAWWFLQLETTTVFDGIIVSKIDGSNRQTHKRLKTKNKKQFLIIISYVEFFKAENTEKKLL